MVRGLFPFLLLRPLFLFFFKYRNFEKTKNYIKSAIDNKGTILILFINISQILANQFKE